MKMVKSLLLGSAAGLVAIAGAQAADLPVKAKPVQYVKICSLYGVGFYYIPGTDMCLKVGGWVRAEYAYGTNGSSVGTMNGDQNLRSTNMSWWRERGYITADARNQTAYGTVRGYIAVGLSTNTTGANLDNAANQFDANRVFIQWAGFTFGRAQSFFDFYSAAAPGYLGLVPSEDTGDSGQDVLAYTAQFGNGFSASISAEARRTSQIINANGVGLAAGSATGSAAGVTVGGSFSATGSTVTGAGAYGGWQAPDVVGNLRVDQAWGSAQVMAAYHDVNATYYNTGAAVGGLPPFQWSGHPGDKAGWVIGGGIKLNAPMIGKGDYFQAEANYTEGALRYLAMAQGGGNYWLSNGRNVAYGILSDGVYGGQVGLATQTGVNLTTGFSVNASYEHFWNDQWRTSVYGSYLDVSYNAQANAQLCTMQGFGNIAAGGANVGNNVVATAGCDNDWQMWTVGSRTQWNVTPDLYLGLDVVYARLEGASTPTGALGVNTANAAATAIAANPTVASVGSEDLWAVRFRVHKDFYP